MIELQGLSKNYGRKKVLKDLDLQFEKGMINGVVGANGAGKTTLFKCLCGLEKYNGSILYEGGILKNVTGFLMTNPFFLSKMTGLEYLQLLTTARGINIPNLKSKNIFELPLDEYAENYSTGMKKKLALTGILLQKNEVFVLDEPFNGVDIHSNILIKEVLLKLKSLNKIVILSSHIFSTLGEVCDQLHYLKSGRIEETVDRESFEKIENAMRNNGIQNRIDDLDL